MRLLKNIFYVILWPFRFWRLMLAGVVLLLVAHIIIDQMLLHKLAIQTQQIKEAGYPVTYADLNLSEYTVIDNAHAVYEQAMDMIKKEPDKAAWSHYSLLIGRYVSANPCTPQKEERPLSVEEKVELGNYFQQMQPAFDLLRKSRDCHVCIIPDFMTEINSINARGETVAILVPGLAWMRELTRYAAAKGLWEYQHDNQDAAFDWFAIGLNIANNHYCHPTLLGTLNRIGCVNTVLTAVQLALYEGDISGEIPVSFMTEFQKCLDRNIYAQTFQNERLYSNEMAMRTGWKSQSWRFTRPILSLNELKINQLLCELTDVMMTTDYNQQETTLNAIRQWCEKSSRIYLVPKILVPALLRSVESIRHVMASSGLCDTALKLKQFRQKNGTYPESLSELTQPLPTDPFSGRSFQYVREAKGFTLTSAGNLTWCTLR